MANWKYNINLKDLRNTYEDGGMSISELGERVAQRLRGLPAFATDSDLQDVVDEMEDIEDEEHFDNVLDALYDWGDQEVPPYDEWPPNKMAWIGFAF